MVGRPAQGFTMYHEKDDQKQIAKFSKDLLEGEVFGFDIEVPEKLYDKFSEMAPLFVVQELPDCNISEEMKIYKKKTGRKTFIGTKKITGFYEGKKRFFCKLVWLNGTWSMVWGWQSFFNWLNTNQLSLFNGFQKRWQMLDVKPIKIP